MKDFKNLTIGEIENQIAELQELKEQIKAKPSWRDDFKGKYYPQLDTNGEWSIDVFGAPSPNHYKEKEHIPLEKIALLCDMTEWARVHNEGWVADWDDEDQKKWGITFDDGDKIGINYFWISNQFIFQIVLKSRELAKEFYEEFRDRLHIINK